MPIPRKRFGQHFLHDKSVIERIIAVIAPKTEDHLVEIGPGQGALTVHLLAALPQLEVIEIDRDLIPALELRCQHKGRLIVYEADALTFDFQRLIETQDSRLRLVGNLPYNISTPLIFHLLKYASHIQDMHFMLQKEVVDRMAAMPGHADYGRLSIMVQYHCQVTQLFDVSRTAFYPPPQVESSIVRLAPYQQIAERAADYRHFEMVVREAFSHRRKTLKNSLKNLVSAQIWHALAIDPLLRPEQVPVRDFVKISNQVVNL